MKRRGGNDRIDGFQERIRDLEKDAVLHRKTLEALEALEASRNEVQFRNAKFQETRNLLEKARDHYLDLFDLAPIGYVILDKHGIVLGINLPGAELLGKERSRIVGMPLLTHVSPLDHPECLEHLRRTKQSDATRSSEIEIQKGREGVRRVALRSRRKAIGGSEYQILTTIWDVTEQRAAEKALHQNEAHLRIALDAAGAGTWEWNPSDMRLVWSERHFALLDMYRSVQPSFRRWVQCADASDHSRLHQAGLQASLPSSKIDVEYQVRAADGRGRWLRTIGQVVEAPDPKLVGITLDITSLKVIEDRLTALNFALEERTTEAEARAAQLRSLTSQLARAETHEQARLAEILHDHVQQILVAADLKLSQLIRRSTRTEENVALAQVSGYVREALHRTSSLSKDFNPRILEEAGLHPALTWQAAAMKEEYGLDVRVERFTDLDLADQEVRVIVFRAVKELLFNVVKHAQAPRAHVRLTKCDDAMLSIEVSDSGIGFDVRKSSDPGSPGGQGIPGVRDRILALGGQFHIESVEGRGTRAQIKIPVPSDGRATEETGGSARSKRRARPRVAKQNGPSGKTRRSATSKSRSARARDPSRSPRRAPPDDA